MSRKHAEIEREFIDELAARSGRTLADWMSAIAAADLNDRNAIIDWLRPQGLTFAHASWLERIHHNGGRPIYLGGIGTSDPPPATAPPAPQSLALPQSSSLIASPAATTTVPLRASQTAAAPRPVIPPTASPTQATAPVAELLGRAKGLRPLADFLIREIGQALPGAGLSAAGDLVRFTGASEVAVLLPGPKELRLGLALAETPFNGSLMAARIPGAGPQITHMLVVNDARQIGPALLDLVRRAGEQDRAGG